MKSFTAGENEEGMRLSRFVLSVTQNLPTSLLYKSFRNGRVKVNRKKAPADARLATGDVIELYINDEFFAAAAQKNTRPPTDAYPPAFDIVWQNEYIAVLYKPAGLLCHSDSTGDPTLLDEFITALTQTGEYNPAAENTFAPALCNRLDRGTEGLVLAAKRYASLRDMNEIIRLNLLQKTYLCVVLGIPPEGTHTAFLQREKATKTVRISNAETPGAKPITTGIRVLERHKNLCLCEIELITGRTHQIRAHLAFLGAPVLGDRKYGSPAANRQFHTKTQLLCAYRLCFAKALPQNSTLAYLAGKTFSAHQASLPAWWKKFTSG